MNIYSASYLLPVNGSPVAGGAIAVSDGRIVATGKSRDLQNRFSCTVREFPGCVLMPGLVNAHTHLELTHFPSWVMKNGLGYSPRSYVDWIIQVIKVKRSLTVDDLSRSLLEGCKKSLLSGTTMVGELSSDRRLLPLYEGCGLSGRVYLEFIGQDAERYKPLIDLLKEDIGSLPDEMFPGLAPHAPFTVSSELLAELAGYARIHSLPITAHLAESAEELRLLKDGEGDLADKLYSFVGWQDHLVNYSGSTPLKWLESGSAQDLPVSAVHAVHLSYREICSLKENGSCIVLCPRSNANLDVGKAPAWLMKQAGIPMAIGTDSLASSDSLSVFDEIRFLLDCYPELFSPEDALRMATINGAAAIMRGDDAGSLEVGKRADFLAVEVSGKLDGSDLFEQILDGGQLRGVWVAGRES
jgi:cytosine/adenosine deaminase-related metal-dependent hydrolase